MMFSPLFRGPRPLLTGMVIGASILMPMIAFAQQPGPGTVPGTSTLTSTASVSAEIAAIKKALEQKFAGASISGITKSPYLGLYEVQFDDQLIYTDARVSFVFVGAVYDTNTKRNLTEERMRKLARISWESLPLELAIKKVKGNGQRKVAVFSDPDCPFCARLENEFKNIDNVTIYTFVYPIDQLHPDATRKSHVLWCASDRVAAWDTWFATQKLPDNSGQCDNPVEKTVALGQKLRINATPTLVFADGSMVPGALPAARLEQQLKQAEAAPANAVNDSGRPASEAAKAATKPATDVPRTPAKK